jgi:hypothetical protein
MTEPEKPGAGCVEETQLRGPCLIMEVFEAGNTTSPASELAGNTQQSLPAQAMR